MSHTPEQDKVVRRVLLHQPHQYYEILEVTKSALELEIKRSYRKLAIKLHPDKNPHARASEAFKLVNKAWGVLLDPQKKQLFDQTGADPDDRSGFARASSTGFRGAETQDDIFEMFFGQRGGGFNFAPQGQTFSFGPGFSFQTFDGFNQFGGQDFFRPRPTPQRTQRQRERDPTLSETIRQFLPFLFILLILGFGAVFSEETPNYSLLKHDKYTEHFTTPNYGIPYFVSEKTAKGSRSKMRQFGLSVEKAVISEKRKMCHNEMARRDDLVDEAHGWFSVDTDKLAAAKQMPMPACDMLKLYGLF